MKTPPIPTPPKPSSRPRAWSGECAVLLDDREIRVPASAWTHEGFRNWAKSGEFPEQARISFLCQEILIDMSPEEIETHNKVKSEISRVIQNLNKKVARGQFYSDRVLVTNVSAGLSTEPD